MSGEVRAVIDVGTNSVKLLVGEVTAAGVLPLYESSHQTRLGQGFYETHQLQSSAIRETARAVADFAATARARNSASIKIIATSAARDAINKQELLDAIRESSGIEVTIISGEQEAHWAYQGVTTDPALAGRPLLVMDVGGGSTEFIAGRGSERLFAESFALGSVRLLERLPLSDPPQSAEYDTFRIEIDRILETQVRPHLQPILRTLGPSVQLVGTGGTSTILARISLGQEMFDRNAIEATILPHREILNQATHLWSLPLAERRHIPGLPANRADVILPGVLIFERVLAKLGLDTVRPSTRGIRFAALLAR